MCALGVADDLWSLDAITKLAGQALAAGIMAVKGVQLVMLPIAGVTVLSPAVLITLTVLTVVVTVSDPIPLGVEQIANVAYETGTTPPVCDPTVVQCAIIPTDDPPQLSVTKTVDATTVVHYGATVTYTVRVDNVGIVPANNVTISDVLPTGISSFDWTCAAQNGATCPNASGSGAIVELVPVFPAGGGLIYTITAVVADAAPAQILNVVMVSPPGAVQCMPGGTPPPCSAQATVRTASAAITVAVPVDARWLQIMLALMLLGGAMVTLRSR